MVLKAHVVPHAKAVQYTTCSKGFIGPHAVKTASVVHIGIHTNKIIGTVFLFNMYKLQHPRQGSMSAASRTAVLSGELQLTCWISIYRQMACMN